MGLDDDGITAPKFVADNFNSMPPLSGFEVIASHMVDLMSEIEAVKIEIINLKEAQTGGAFGFKTDVREELYDIKNMIRNTCDRDRSS